MQFFKNLQRGHADYKITVNRRNEPIKRGQIGNLSEQFKTCTKFHFIFYFHIYLHILNQFSFYPKINTYNQVAGF